MCSKVFENVNTSSTPTLRRHKNQCVSDGCLTKHFFISLKVFSHSLCPLLPLAKGKTRPHNYLSGKETSITNRKSPLCHCRAVSRKNCCRRWGYIRLRQHHRCCRHRFAVDRADLRLHMCRSLQYFAQYYSILKHGFWWHRHYWQAVIT
jgi:hypothetical protein